MIRLLACSAGAVFLATAGVAHAQADVSPRHKEVTYKGFVIDISAVDTSAARDSVLAGVRVQIDIVDGLRVADSVKRFFRSVPLVMVISTPRGSAAYGGGQMVMPLKSSAPYDREHPVLLHELCHAYHEQQVPNGFANARIRELYAQAQKSGAFPAGSYMLSNPNEYFAMMASVYLHGSAAREPFTRAAIKAKQPEMLEWLARTFGAM